jgi:hypothetical protein
LGYFLATMLALEEYLDSIRAGLDRLAELRRKS